MDFIKINDVTYAYQQQEANLPPLLMLHGFMGDHRVFDHLNKKLTKFCNPIVIDLLGYGESSKPSNPDRHHESKQIKDILFLINKLKLQNPYLYGYSMGGRLALKIALAQPNSFQGLILESANCGITEKQARLERQKVDNLRADQIEDDFESFLSGWTSLDLFDSPLPIDKKLAQKYHRIQSEQLPAALAASLRGFGTGTMTPAYNEVTNFTRPVLLLAGSADKKYQQINNELVNRFPNAIFKSVKAGHRVHLDNPTALLNEIKNFITINKST